MDLSGGILPAHQHFDLGTKRLFVELDRFVATAVEK
jgi:hypothetical protein